MWFSHMYASATETNTSPAIRSASTRTEHLWDQRQYFLGLQLRHVAYLMAERNKIIQSLIDFLENLHCRAQKGTELLLARSVHCRSSFLFCPMQKHSQEKKLHHVIIQDCHPFCSVKYYFKASSFNTSHIIQFSLKV